MHSPLVIASQRVRAKRGPMARNDDVEATSRYTLNRHARA